MAEKARAEREWERLRASMRIHNGQWNERLWDDLSEPQQNGWIAFVATLPPRPVRSPGERLCDVLIAKRVISLPWREREGSQREAMEAAAKELGIEACED